MNTLLTYLIPLAFAGVVVYVYRPWAKKRYQKDADIPFADGDKDSSGKNA